ASIGEVVEALRPLAVVPSSSSAYTSPYSARQAPILGTPLGAAPEGLRSLRPGGSSPGFKPSGSLSSPGTRAAGSLSNPGFQPAGSLSSPGTKSISPSIPTP